MKTISISEFRANTKKYLDIALEERVFLHRGKGKTYAIVPIEEMEEKAYHPDFLEKISRSLEDSKQGRFTKINTDDLWK